MARSALLLALAALGALLLFPSSLAYAPPSGYPAAPTFYQARWGLPYLAPGFGFYFPSLITPRPYSRAPPMPEQLSDFERGYYAGYDEGYAAGLDGQYDGLYAYMAFQFETEARFDATPKTRYYYFNYQPKKITVRSVMTDYDDGYKAGLERGFRDGFLGQAFEGVPPEVYAAPRYEYESLYSSSDGSGFGARPSAASGGASYSQPPTVYAGGYGPSYGGSAPAYESRQPMTEAPAALPGGGRFIPISRPR